MEFETRHTLYMYLCNEVDRAQPIRYPDAIQLQSLRDTGGKKKRGPSRMLASHCRPPTTASRGALGFIPTMPMLTKWLHLLLVVISEGLEKHRRMDRSPESAARHRIHGSLRIPSDGMALSGLLRIMTRAVVAWCLPEWDPRQCVSLLL
jgi:hypothetical protein